MGHTAQRTREQVKKALGGVLFIDEAYALARGGEKDFGKEAVDTLVKAMEDHKDQLVLILAGYTREMQAFLKSNPGLSSRIPIHLEFPDYTCVELLRIGEHMAATRQYRMDDSAKAALHALLQRERKRYEENRGNARFVRNLIEAAIRMQAVRLYHSPHQVQRRDLELVREEDFIRADQYIARTVPAVSSGSRGTQIQEWTPEVEG